MNYKNLFYFDIETASKYKYKDIEIFNLIIIYRKTMGKHTKNV